MNANDLIDKIEKIQNNPLERIDWWVLQFVVPMLRQQQAEIEALKKQLEKDVTDGIHKNLMSLYDKKASEK